MSKPTGVWSLIRALPSVISLTWRRFLLWLSVGQADTLSKLTPLYSMSLGPRIKLACLKFWAFCVTFTVLRFLKFCAVLAVISYALVLVLIAALSIPDQSIAAHQPVDRIVFQNQGWGAELQSEKRQAYYFTPQGTSLSNLRYSWFVHLERAWTTKRLADPQNMARLGFLVDDAPTKKNPDRLPVGFTQHYVPRLNDRVVDITCAACHTGQLDVTSITGQRVGIRIDGGQAPHAFTSLSPGQFGPSVVASMLSTAINPFKFHRLAAQILGPGASFRSQTTLYRDFVGVLGALSGQAFSDVRRHLYSVNEGYGRLDAIDRIANHVFGDELSHGNYHKGNAPVSYPALWDIWKFDWVQYTASVAQPLARNLGETLGVGAELSMCDRYGQPLAREERYVSGAIIPNLVNVEDDLQHLSPPAWPEEILGKIDRPKAELGHALFQEHCARCHQPCEMNEEDRAVLVPGKKPDQSHWHLKAIPITVIGTDPTSALNFVNNQYDLTKTGLKVDDVRSALQQSWNEREKRINAFRASKGMPPVDLKDYTQNQLAQVNLEKASVGAGLNYIGMFLRRKYYADKQDSKVIDQQVYDGFGALDLPEVKPQYKARPLGGVWATAPYLHNGSVPTLYEMLIPADGRSKRFFAGRREFDPVHVGLLTEPLSNKGFWLDTSIQGNWNIGHEFRKGYTGQPANGVIGPELQDSERLDIIEYLKVLTDDKPPACPYTYSEPATGSLKIAALKP